MKYGCIGEHLKHSFSKEIHNALADYEYELKEIPKEDINEFMEKRQFEAINVTIPYKEAVIEHLYFIDDAAKKIGAVNTVVNKKGKLYGYNTDFYGMTMLIFHAGIDISGKKVAILGTGGTSKTAFAVAKTLLAKEILTVSRKKTAGSVTYDELYESHRDIDVIINTTPLGMYPNIFGKAICVECFPKLSGVIDAVYNPIRTQLVAEALENGIKAEGGLYMLVAQAVKASEIFLDKKYDEKVLDDIYTRLKRQKENIVLIGMPSSGKSTVGRNLAEKLSRNFYDTDELIEQKTGQKIPEMIQTDGEVSFRKIESEIVAEASKLTGAVIATGGGVVLNQENTKALAQNGKIYFLDRPIDLLMPTSDRPLTSTRDALLQKYYERYPLYEKAASVKLDASGDISTVTNLIIGDFEK